MRSLLCVAQMRSLLCVAILAADVSAQTYGSASPGATCAPGQRCAISASTGCYDGSIPGLTPIVQSQLNATLQQALVLLSQLDGQNATEVTAQLQQQLVEAGAALDGANATELNETLQDALAQPLDALLGPDGVENAAFFGINTSTPLTLLLSRSSAPRVAACRRTPPPSSPSPSASAPPTPTRRRRSAPT